MEETSMDNGHVYLLSAFQEEENSQCYDCPILATFTKTPFYNSKYFRT